MFNGPDTLEKLKSASPNSLAFGTAKRDLYEVYDETESHLLAITDDPKPTKNQVAHQLVKKGRPLSTRVCWQ